MRQFIRKIIGLALVLVFLVSAYTLIAQAVQQFNNKSLIDQLELLGANDLNTTKTQFHAGEILIVRALVKEADAYSVTIYDKNGSVFIESGRVSAYATQVRIPLDPPDFHAGQSYLLVFSASISVYPIPGASVTDTKMAAFSVVSVGTKLSLASVYGDSSYSLTLHVSLKDDDGNPVTGKLVKFYLQPYSSSNAMDRGWIPLTAARTDTNGTISLPLLCRLYSGLHHVKAKFDGDGDFGAAENVTGFYTAPRVPRIGITRIGTSQTSTFLALRIVDDASYPLFGKMLTVDFGNCAGVQSLLRTTDMMGNVALTLTGLAQTALNQSVLRIKKDLWTSAVSIGFRNLTMVKDLQSFPSSAVEYSASASHAATDQGTLGLSVSPSQAPYYAMLPMIFNATYQGNVSNSTSILFSFNLDGRYQEACNSTKGRGNAKYSTLFIWYPNMLGSHFMQVQATLLDRTALGTVNSANFTLNPCPSNLEIYTPQITYGNSANVTVVFSMPRAYQAENGSSLFYSYNLAPGLNYSSTLWKIDSGFEATVRLYYNSTDVYLRNTNRTVNGLLACNLSALQGTSERDNWLYAQSGRYATWGIRAWNRSSSGNETELTGGTPVARVQRTNLGGGLQNNTWSCPGSTLGPGASVVVRWYVGRGLSPTVWTLLANSSTGRLGPIRLNASIWRACYNTAVFYSETYYNKYDYGLSWGDSSDDTRIMNFTYPPSSGGFTDLTLACKNGASTTNWAVSLAGRQRVTYNFKMQVLDPLFNESVTSRTITFTKVAVNASNGNNYLALNCSLGTTGQDPPQVYVGAAGAVTASVGLFGMPVYNANASVAYARYIPATYMKSGISAGRTLQVPSGANFLRVASIYTNAGLDADINYLLNESTSWSVSADGKVSTADLTLLAANNGKSVPPADPRADINHDGMVNQADGAILSADWGKSGSYVPSFGARANFSVAGQYQSVPVDSGGCVCIPSGASTVCVSKNGQPVGAFILFFSATFASPKTDTSGIARSSWTPTAAGDYLLEIKLSPTFNAIASQPTATTSVSESVCLVKYVQVIKRPVDLNVTCSPGERYSDSTYMYWDASPMNDTYVYSPQDTGEYYSSYGPYNDINRLRIGATWYNGQGANRVFETYIIFDVPPHHPDALVKNAQLTLSGKFNYSYPIPQNLTPYEQFAAYAVNQSWNEKTTQEGYWPGWYPNINSTAWVNLISAQSPGVWFASITFNVTRAVQSWYSGSKRNFGFFIKDLGEDTILGGPQQTIYAMFEGYSIESGQYMHLPTLSIDYSRPTVDVAVKATDPTAGGTPVSGLGISGHQTNAQGEATWQLLPLTNDPLGVISGPVATSGSSIYAAADASASLDTRYVTLLNSQYGNLTSAYVGLNQGYGFRLTCPCLNGSLVGVHVGFWIDHFNASDPWSIWPDFLGVTDGSGQATLNYAFNTSGTHYVYAYWSGYNGTSDDLISNTYDYFDWYRSCNATMAVVVSSVPLGIDFSVSPSDLDLSRSNQLTLNATILDLRSNSVFAPSQSYTVNFTEINPNGAVTRFWPITQQYNGKFIKSITYPGGNSAYAYKAQVVGTQSLLQSLASSAVQLTVGTPTKLLLNVTRDFGSTRHVFTFRLLSNGSPVYNKTIMLKLNSTSYTAQQYSSLRTSASGYAWLALYLSPQASNNQTAYNVVSSFSGDSASVATASMTTINGTNYAVCTTTQYNSYMPSSNSTAITVTPQTTTGATTLVDMATMQKAQGEGFQVWGEPTGIFPPWYILHIRIGLGSADEYVQFGLSLFGLYVEQFSGVESLMNTFYGRVNVGLMDKVVSAVTAGIITSSLTFVGGLITTRLAKMTIFGISAAEIAIILYAAFLFGTFLYFANSYDKVTASTALLTVGLALAGFCCRYASLIRFLLPAPDYVQTAIRIVVNSYTNSFIKSGIMGAMGITTEFDADFMIATAALAGVAILMAGILSI